MTTPITYIGCRTAPRELTAILNHEVVATAANDSDCYPISTAIDAVALTGADIIPIKELH